MELILCIVVIIIVCYLLSLTINNGKDLYNKKKKNT